MQEEIRGTTEQVFVNTSRPSLNFFHAEKENSECIKIELVHVCMCMLDHNQECAKAMVLFGSFASENSKAHALLEE